MKTKYVSTGLLLLLVVLLASCGSNQSTRTISTNIRVAVTPTTLTLDQGATLQFSATVTGTTNTGVTWSVLEQNGGTITAQGIYTAPTRAGAFHVIATSAADQSKTASSQVMINSVLLSITPNIAETVPNGTLQFAATATGTVNHDVIWSVREGTAGGTITSAGMYTAPSTPGQFHVVVTSASDTTASINVGVTIANPAVYIFPQSLNLLPGSARTLNATVLGSMDDRVTWAVQEGNPGGSISSDGVYTAPQDKGEYHVVATSVAFSGASATATVTITDSGFTDAGPMVEARYNHSATLLPNGDVLLAGGATDVETATAELFDHTTNTFHATGNMTEARASHTATLLPNGKVLITGGAVDGGFGPISLDSAELYDPATGQFTPAGKMNARRNSHTATLLPNGKVLIAAGFWYDGFADSAELYDPETGAFSLTGSIHKPRGNHTATLLPDGKVLVAGGWTEDGNDSCEIYDPVTGTFTVSAPLPRRSMLTATSLDDGRVLLAGGYWWDWDGSEPTYYADAQYFDPATGQLKFAASLNENRYGHTETKLFNGDVLLTGGWNSEDRLSTVTSTTKVFISSIAKFMTSGTMKTARVGHTATRLLDGRVLVAGGSEDRSAELYIQKQ